MKRFVLYAALIVAVGLVASAAMADQCKPISVRLPAGEYLGSCEYNGVPFEFCIESPVTGTLNGIWYYYGPASNWVEWSDENPAPPSYSPFWAGWALDVIATNQGEIWAQDNFLFNLNTSGNKAGFPIVSISSITGGTGHYEEAWGWFGVIADDSGNWKGFMKGEICVP